MNNLILKIKVSADNNLTKIYNVVKLLIYLYYILYKNRKYIIYFLVNVTLEKNNQIIFFNTKIEFILVLLISKSYT